MLSLQEQNYFKTSRKIKTYFRSLWLQLLQLAGLEGHHAGVSHLGLVLEAGGGGAWPDQGGVSPVAISQQLLQHRYQLPARGGQGGGGGGRRGWGLVVLTHVQDGEPAVKVELTEQREGRGGMGETRLNFVKFRMMWTHWDIDSVGVDFVL